MHSHSPRPAGAAAVLASFVLLAVSGVASGHGDGKKDDHGHAPAPAPAPAPAEKPSHGHGHGERPPEPTGTWFEGEKHLDNVRQLTFGGQNAEAYWSHDGRLILQATPQDLACDQIYVLDLEAPADEAMKLVSTGKGRTTCAYFVPGTDRIVYSSTHEASDECPPAPDHSQGYVWPIYPGYDIFIAKDDGTELEKLTDTGFYDAEATLSVDGEWIVFTSTRDGDLDLYKMRADGTEVTRLTDEPGYDGGAFFSPDGTKICYRASRPAEGEVLDDYRRLLGQDMIRPSALEIYVMDADGSNKVQVTSNGAANFAPFFTPDGERLLFASNVGDPRGRNFDIYLINVDGSGFEQVTYCSSFDSFPMFSYDGKRLAFASNRNGAVPGETNIFVADWID